MLYLSNLLTSLTLPNLLTPMNLIEPQRWQSLIHILNTATFNSPVLVKLVPILADVFVFTYPVLLLVWYVTGIIKKDQTLKSQAITIFSWAAYVTIINLTLQSFLHKDRPIFAWDNAIHMILQDLPTASFPSDHAAVSMIVWLMVVLIAFKQKNKLLRLLALALIISSIIMSISRVAVWVHWPTDIIAGWGVAIIVASLMSFVSIRGLQQEYINQPLINIQERIFTSLWINKILPK